MERDISSLSHSAAAALGKVVLHLDCVADPADSEADELPENFILEDLARTLPCHMVV